MTAHYSGGIWNSSEIGRSLGEAHATVKRHLDALSGGLVVRVREPWYANVGKRFVKSPKVYIWAVTDSLRTSICARSSVISRVLWCASRYHLKAGAGT